MQVPALLLLVLTATMADASAFHGSNSDNSASGCYMWNEFNRVLLHDAIEGSFMTRTYCSDTCVRRSMRYFGLVAGSKCLCGDRLFSSMKMSPSECGWRCSGDFAETCGSDSTIQVLETAEFSRGRSQEAGLKFGDQVVGCYVPSSYYHVLSQRAHEGENMSQDFCEKECLRQSFKFFGLRAGRSCYCGNSMQVGRTVHRDNCGWRCTGSMQEACGSDRTMLVFKVSDRFRPKISLAEAILALNSPKSLWTYESCVTLDSRDSRMAFYYGESEAMTHRYCYDRCVERAAKYFGLTQGNLCMCDYLIDKLKPASLNLCESRRCSGDQMQFCAGEDTALVFKIKAKLRGKLLKLENCAQGSTSNGSTCNLAIDGNTDQNYYNGSCTLSQASAPYTFRTVKGWWMADLSWHMQVLEVKIYNRVDCCAERLNDFIIAVDHRVCASHKSSVAFSQKTFPCIDVGRSVRIESHLPYLSLCEVQVFGAN